MSDADDLLDPGMVRAGAAAAARRRELDISQRSLAVDRVINAGALISFEKGRSWPRARTRARLEEVLRWPAGTIDRLRHEPHDAPVGASGPAPVPVSAAAPAPIGAGAPAGAPPTDPGPPVDPTPQVDEGSLLAQAVVAAVNSLTATVAALPGPGDPDHARRTGALLADLRQLESVAAKSARLGRVTPALLRALSTVRRWIDELTTSVARGPDATLGQRLYAARRAANLTSAEAARAAGVDEAAVVATESESAVTADAEAALRDLVEQLDWR